MALLSNKFRPNAVVDTTALKHFEKKLQTLGGLTVKQRRKEMQKVTNYAIRPTTALMKQKSREKRQMMIGHKTSQSLSPKTKD